MIAFPNDVAMTALEVAVVAARQRSLLARIRQRLITSLPDTA